MTITKIKHWQKIFACALVATFSLIFVAIPVFAETLATPASTETVCTDVAKNCTSILPGDWCYSRAGTQEILQLILNIMTAGIGIAATIGLVIAGIQWMTARDKEDQVTRSKARIFNIVIGMAVWGIMWVVLGWLIPSFTINIPSVQESDKQKEICIDVIKPPEDSLDEDTPSSGSTDAAPANFTGYRQSASPWGSKPYGKCSPSKTYGQAGCGPAAVASIITSMTGKKVTPDQVGVWAIKEGYRECGGGSKPDIAKTVRHFGLEFGGTVSISNISKMSEHLRNGAMLLTSVSRNTALGYTGEGHYIAIRGITADGKWLVYDSGAGNSRNFNKSFTPSSLTKSFKHAPRVIYKK